MCFVLGGHWTAVLEGRHLFTRLVDIGVVVLGLLALDYLGIVVCAAGEGATQSRAERHGEVCVCGSGGGGRCGGSIVRCGRSENESSVQCTDGGWIPRRWAEGAKRSVGSRGDLVPADS